jgi:hypothetical protein
MGNGTKDATCRSKPASGAALKALAAAVLVGGTGMLLSACHTSPASTSRDGSAYRRLARAVDRSLMRASLTFLIHTKITQPLTASPANRLDFDRTITAAGAINRDSTGMLRITIRGFKPLPPGFPVRTDVIFVRTKGTLIGYQRAFLAGAPPTIEPKWTRFEPAQIDRHLRRRLKRLGAVIRPAKTPSVASFSDIRRLLSELRSARNVSVERCGHSAECTAFSIAPYDHIRIRGRATISGNQEIRRISRDYTNKRIEYRTTATLKGSSSSVRAIAPGRS